MPMATPELAAKFQNDGEAWEALEKLGWLMDRHGYLIPPSQGYRPADGRESDAVEYLCDEFDYSFDPNRQ